MKKINTENLVLVVEEFGYKYWLWNPDFPISELKTYWQNVENADYVNMQKVLSGSLWCMEEQPEDKFQDYWDKFHELLNTKEFPYLHYCCNQDSYLIINNETIYHKGYLALE